MALKTKLVDVEGIGQVEIRELTYAASEPLLAGDPAEQGKSIIKASLFINGVNAFDNPNLSFSEATKLFGLIQDVLEINGLNGSGKK